MATLKKLKPKTHNLSALVDELGDLKSKIAELQLREKEIKEILCASGETMVRGQEYQAAIIHAERTSLDGDLVKTFLSPAQIVACAKVTAFTAVRVSARSE